MMKNILLLIAIFAPTDHSFAQDYNLFGDSGSQLNITWTIKLSGISKNDVYNKIATWWSVKISGMDGLYVTDREAGASADIPAQKQVNVGKGEKAYYLGEGLSKSFRQSLITF